MLKIIIPPKELYDESNNQFLMTQERILQLEHSLVSLSKWESKWCKPFLTSQKKTEEETIDYIRCMTITQNVPDEAYQFLTRKNVKEVEAYIESPMTATTFSDEKHVINRNIITAEIIYYWMITLQIPSEYQKWHLNKLLTLINVCNIKNQPKKKMSKKAIFARNKALNEARRQQLNSTG